MLRIFRRSLKKEDVELFSTLAEQIERERRKAERNRQLGQSHQRQRGRGLSR